MGNNSKIGNRNLQVFNNFYCSHLSSNKKISIKGPLSLNQGDRLLITGPSGGGKSTLLSVMKGLIPHYIKANISSKESFSSSLSFAESTYIFQNPLLQTITSSAKQEFFFNLENKKTKEDIAKNIINYFTSKFRIDYLYNENKLIKDLSSSEVQKINLISALSINPRLLLLDEPTAFLDSRERKIFYRDLFQPLKKEDGPDGPMTLVIVDHHITEVLPYVNRIWKCNIEGSFSEVDAISFQNKLNPLIKDRSFFNCDHMPQKIKSTIKIKSDEIITKNNHFIKQVEHGNILFIYEKDESNKNKLIKQLASYFKDDISYCFQNPESQFFFETIKKEIVHENKNASIDELTSYAEWIGINIDELERSPYQLSEGQKKRLALLLASISQKKIIFIDNPTLGQDEDNKIKIWKMIEENQHSKKIQIIITNDFAPLSQLNKNIFHYITEEEKYHV